MSHDFYENPLITRYSSRQMASIWGDQNRFSTWRKLWIALAESQQELGLDITADQIQELKQHVNTIDFETANRYEREKRHDVVAHIHAYGDQCPQARPIIHLGATSCFVTDNTDLILLREALELTRQKLAKAIDRLARFATQFRALPCLGFTHLQPAQPPTLGKRATLWLYDLAMDLDELELRSNGLKARGTKGTTGTQASFLKLFDGDHAKVEQLDEKVSRKLGFEQSYAVTGQTYSRKIDSQILATLSGLAQSCHKIATDLRILAHRKEVEEPFESGQVGSSAMAYKRNPMRSERICGLSRYVISLADSPAQTLATQWMERTLDDSANRRLVIPQAFLAIDAILILLNNVADGLVVYEQVIQKQLLEELPFMATENILMAAVSAGGDRQTLHELIRQHSQDAAQVVKQQGLSNDLLGRLKADSAFDQVDIDRLVEPSQFVGRAPEQVDQFVSTIIQPIRDRYASTMDGHNDEVKV